MPNIIGFIDGDAIDVTHDTTGENASIAAYNTTVVAPPASGDGDFMAGRTTLIVPDVTDPATITDITITAEPTNGSLSLLPDGETIALNLVLDDPAAIEGLADSFTYSVTSSDGTESVTENYTIADAARLDGFALGDAYFPENDGSEFTIEPTLDHKSGGQYRVIHVATDGMSASNIVSAEASLSQPDEVNAVWLRDNAATGGAGAYYGETPALALDEELASALYQNLFSSLSQIELRFNRGQTFTGSYRFFEAETGFSPLHPHAITAYGTGANPVVSGFNISPGGYTANLIVQNLSGETLVKLKHCVNVAIGNVRSSVGEFDCQQSSRVGHLNCGSFEVYARAPVASSGQWGGSAERLSNFHRSKSSGTVYVGCYSDIGGMALDASGDPAWTETSPGVFDPAQGCPPSSLSQAVYDQATNLGSIAYDVTYFNCAVARAAGNVQFRGGANLQNLVSILHNNGGITGGAGAASDVLGEGTARLVANYTVVDRHVHMGALIYEGFRGTGNPKGFKPSADLGAYLEIAVLHDDDPDATPRRTKEGQSAGSYIPDGTQIVSQGVGAFYSPGNADPNNSDVNVGGLDMTSGGAVELANIWEYAETHGTFTGGRDVNAFLIWLRDQDASTFKDEVQSMLNDWLVAAGFTSKDTRVSAQTCEFSPSASASGVCWHERDNWSDREFPINGDSVDMNGAEAVSNLFTLSLVNLSNAPLLRLLGGKLSFSGTVGAGKRQVWPGAKLELPAATGQDILIREGRVRLQGAVTGDVDMRGGELVLDASASLSVTNTMSLYGPRCFVGADGPSGSATITIESGATLNLINMEYWWVTSYDHWTRFVEGEAVAIGAESGTVMFEEEGMRSRNDQRTWLGITGLTGVAAADTAMTGAGRGAGTWDATQRTETQIANIASFCSGLHGSDTPTTTTSLVLASGSTVVVSGYPSATVLAENVTDNGATLTGCSVNGSSELVAD